jgi:peroxiredoxin
METPPIAGERAQDFELLDSTRTPRRLSELTSRGAVVLLFYRGNW